MNKALVTGGAGFVGNHLVKKLLDKEIPVVIIDDLSTGRIENIPDNVKFFEGDIRDKKLLEFAAKGCHTIFHLAARVELQKSIVDPSDCFSVNITGTANVVMEAIKVPDRKLVFASSCSVYPLNPQTSLTEEMSNAGSTPYAMSKVMGERMMEFYHKTRGLNYIALRCFNIYGLGQRADSQYAAVIPKFIEAVIKNKSLELYGGGIQTRDFIHVNDVIRGYIKASQSSYCGTLNIGTGKDISIKELAEHIIKISNSKILPKIMPSKEGDASNSCANIDKIISELDFKPRLSIKKGIEMIFENLKMRKKD